MQADRFSDYYIFKLLNENELGEFIQGARRDHEFKHRQDTGKKLAPGTKLLVAG